MALATTTLTTAVTVLDKTIVVASATSFAPGRFVRIDDEIMQVAQGYVTASLTVPVLRGREGSQTSAHVVTANVTHGLASDLFNAVAQVALQWPTQKPRIIQSYTAATSTMVLPPAGTDLVVVLNSTVAITLTIPVPTQDLDGTLLWVISNGVAAHVPTFTGGLGGVGAGYTAFTVGTGARLAIQCIAVNGAWNVISAPAWTGTVTKVTGGIA